MGLKVSKDRFTQVTCLYSTFVKDGMNDACACGRNPKPNEAKYSKLCPSWVTGGCVQEGCSGYRMNEKSKFLYEKGQFVEIRIGQ
jgi:hypothetical protein